MYTRASVGRVLAQRGLQVSTGYSQQNLQMVTLVHMFAMLRQSSRKPGFGVYITGSIKFPDNSPFWGVLKGVGKLGETTICGCFHYEPLGTETAYVAELSVYVSMGLVFPNVWYAKIRQPGQYILYETALGLAWCVHNMPQVSSSKTFDHNENTCAKKSRSGEHKL